MNKRHANVFVDSGGTYDSNPFNEIIVNEAATTITALECKDQNGKRINVLSLVGISGLALPAGTPIRTPIQFPFTKISVGDGSVSLDLLKHLNYPELNVPQSDEIPEITGADLNVGTEQTLSDGTWESTSPSTITYAKRWYMDDEPIEDETGDTYTPVAAGELKGSVIATNEIGESVEVFSLPVTIVQP